MMLFPDIERTDVYQNWNTDPVSNPLKPTDAPYTELLVCPSNPPDSPGQPSLSYVANCGKQDPTPPATTPPSSLVSPATVTSPERMQTAYSSIDIQTPAHLQQTRLRRLRSLWITSPMVPATRSCFRRTTRPDRTSQGGHSATTTRITYDKTVFNVADAEHLTGFVWVPDPVFTPAASSTQPANFALKINSDRDALKAYSPSGSGPNYFYSRPSSQSFRRRQCGHGGRRCFLHA